MYIVLYKVCECVCNRFLCKWLDAWSSPMLFACDPVYNVCIINEVRSYSSQTHRSGEFKGDNLSATHTHTVMTSMHVWQAYRLDLNFWTLMHSLSLHLHGGKQAIDWLMFEDSVYTCNRPEKVTRTRARKMDFQFQTTPNSNFASKLLPFCMC